jgi:hypothetical protein
VRFVAEDEARFAGTVSFEEVWKYGAARCGIAG